MIELAATVVLTVLLSAGSMIDARSMRLPDWTTLSLVAIGLALSLAGGATRLWECAAAAGVGFLAFWAIGVVHALGRGGPGLGLGDAKLLAAVGAWLGPLALAPVVLLASLLALGFVAARRLAGHAIDSRTAVPFGPFLSLAFAAGWAATLAGWV